MKILFLSTWYPSPADNGSKLRILSLLRGLAAGNTVSLISFANGGQGKAGPDLQHLCREIHVLPNREYKPTSLRSLVGLLSWQPRVVFATHDGNMARLIRRELSRSTYDVVVASQWRMAAYWPEFFHLPSVFEELEIGALESKRTTATNPVGRLRHELTLAKLRHYLRRVLPRFRACTVASETERQLLKEMVPAYSSVQTIPNCVDLSQYPSTLSSPTRNTLIFAGSLSYFANYDAIKWFIEEAFPIIRAHVPEARLVVTGDPGNRRLPVQENVHLTGYLEDVKPVLGSAAVSLAPIRLGGGTRLKVLESMALRVPVVATTLGAQGLDVVDGEHLLMEDTAAGFANAVVKLLKDPGHGQKLAENAYRLVGERYEWSVVLPRFLDVVEEAAQGRGSLTQGR